MAALNPEDPDSDSFNALDWIDTSTDRADLIKPEEVLQGLRYDEQIVLIQNAPPLRCGRAIDFRRPEMLARVKGNADRVPR